MREGKSYQTLENWKRCPVCGSDFSVLSLEDRDRLGGFSRTVLGGSMVTQFCYKRTNQTHDKIFTSLKGCYV